VSQSDVRLNLHHDDDTERQPYSRLSEY